MANKDNDTYKVGDIEGSELGDAVDPSQGVVDRSARFRREIEEMYVALDAPFEPLGESVRRDYEIAHGPAMQDLVRQCKKRNIRLPEEIEKVSDHWREGLNVDSMSEYCAAVSGFMESRLLNSGAPISQALGFLVSIAQEPCFQVDSLPGSLLEEESGGALEGNRHVYGVSEFAHHIAARCDVDVRTGELAWRFIAALVPEINSAVFPGVMTSTEGRHIRVELRQAPRSQTEA